MTPILPQFIQITIDEPTDKPDLNHVIKKREVLSGDGEEGNLEDMLSKLSVDGMMMCKTYWRATYIGHIKWFLPSNILIFQEYVINST